MNKIKMGIVGTLLCTSVTWGDTISTKVYATQDTSKPLGSVMFTDTPYGLLVIPQLQDLPAGLHGFHLHQHASCADLGMGAGGHFDPANSNHHLGPYGEGHLGDLPALYVDANSQASLPTIAPRLKTSDLHGLAVMIHAGGDNYSDTPALGGGGARLACGAIE